MQKLSNDVLPFRRELHKQQKYKASKTKIFLKSKINSIIFYFRLIFLYVIGWASIGLMLST